MKHRRAMALLLALVAALVSDSPVRAQAPIVGQLPSDGGVALVTWGGGTASDLVVAAEAQGCSMRSAWANAAEGGLVGYLAGAPSFVNAGWSARFAGGVVPPATPLLVVCEVPVNTQGSPLIGGCPVFPSDNPWNTDISGYPVHANSDGYIQYISGLGGNQHLHADFGENPDYGIPYVVVPEGQPSVLVSFDYADESDAGPYPIPPDAPVEAGGDRHVLVLQQGECRLYELFAAEYLDGSQGWHAGSGAVFDLRSNDLRPDTWTSADAAGLPILPGLAKVDEVRSGRIDHALRFTVSRTQRGFIHPATHFASSETDPDAPPMGLRLRLRADFDISGYTGDARVILEALRRYGMIVADNGSNWYISGATDPRWDDDDLNQLKTVPGTAFEVVDTGPVRTG